MGWGLPGVKFSAQSSFSFFHGSKTKLLWLQSTHTLSSSRNTGPPLLKTHHVYLSATNNKCVEQVLLGPRGKPPSMERSALKLDIYPKKSPDPRVICFAAALCYLFVFETFFPKALRRVLPENPLTLTLRRVHLDTPRH